MKQLTILIFLIFIFGILQLHAQKPQAYLALGANLTEAKLTNQGNSQVGTRLGLNVGAGVSMPIHKKWKASMELLYSKNGAYLKLDPIPFAVNKITLHYVEVPLTLGYDFDLKKNKQERFHQLNINGGITYARLFKYEIIAIDGTNLANDIRFDQENALLFNLGATAFLRKSFALNARGTISTFGGWTIALRLLYYI